jgi:hypothetical protein
LKEICHRARADVPEKFYLYFASRAATNRDIEEDHRIASTDGLNNSRFG